MENDSIRSSGGNTLVDIWIEGKLRGICVSRAAIETYLGLSPEQAAAMSEEDRCEFVRKNLRQVVTAATNRLHATNPAADSIFIDAGQLGGSGGSGHTGERRTVERRKTDRRKPEPAGERAIGDRRQTDRRKGGRGKSDREGA